MFRWPATSQNVVWNGVRVFWPKSMAVPFVRLNVTAAAHLLCATFGLNAELASTAAFDSVRQPAGYARAVSAVTPLFVGPLPPAHSLGPLNCTLSSWK